MKKIIIITISFLSILSFLSNLNGVNVLAVTSTPSATATASAKTASTSGSKVQDLLNRVSDKVTKLTDKMRRTYHGPVKSSSDETYVVTTSEGEKKITTNNATDFFRIKAGKRSTIDFDGIKAGDDIVSIGTIDSQTTDMTAKQVIAKIHRSNFVGTISAVDKSIVTITLPDKTTVKVDLSNALTYEKIVNGKIHTAKLSDFVTESTIFVIAYSPDAKTGIYSSLKALTFSK